MHKNRIGERKENIIYYLLFFYMTKLSFLSIPCNMAAYVIVGVRVVIIF